MTPYNPRSPHSQAAYDTYTKEHGHHFVINNENILKKYKFWYIIENRFPYDNMARTNHILISRLPIKSLHKAESEVKEEFDKILSDIGQEGTYDACIENFPKASTVKAHFHVHLVAWHNTAS